MNIIDEIYLYEESMLKIQYNISENISHALTKGEVREDYIKDFITRKLPNTNIYKGIIINEDKQSGQLDFIVPKSNAVVNKIGSHSMLEASECRIVFEIKSTIKMEYIYELNNTARKIKEMNEKIKIGIIGYKLDMEEKTILRKFGYIYDKEIDGYMYDKYKIDNKITLIDYIISIDENSEFLIIKNLDEYVFLKERPIIKYFINILNEE